MSSRPPNARHQRRLEQRTVRCNRLLGAAAADVALLIEVPTLIPSWDHCRGSLSFKK